MRFQLENQSINVVWVAPISPELFMPSWFKQFDLLRDEDIDQAKVAIKDNEVIVDFGWFELKAEPNRVVFKLARVGLEQTYIDLITSILTLLKNIPTAAIGINLNYFYSFNTRENWDKIGNELVPKLLWKEENKSKLLQDSDIEYHYGMKRLDVEIANSNKNKDKLDYYETINLTLIPHLHFDNIPFGLVSNFNHNLRSKDDPDSIEMTEIAAKVLDSQIRSAIENDINTIESIYNRILS